jgi:ribonuclease P protein component
MSMPQPASERPASDKPTTDSRRSDSTDNQQADLTSTRYGPALATIKKRRDFQAIRGGARWSGPAFLMEARPARVAPKRQPSMTQQTKTTEIVTPEPRFGFTITKKLGLAVTRNRIRRRLSHAIRAALQVHPAAPYDYVVVARPPAIDRAFADLISDVTKALIHISNAKPKPPRDTTSP